MVGRRGSRATPRVRSRLLVIPNRKRRAAGVSSKGLPSCPTSRKPLTDTGGGWCLLPVSSPHRTCICASGMGWLSQYISLQEIVSACLSAQLRFSLLSNSVYALPLLFPICCQCRSHWWRWSDRKSTSRLGGAGIRVFFLIRRC